MDHQNSNSSNTAARFARPMESGDNVDRTNGNTFSFVTQKIQWYHNKVACDTALSLNFISFTGQTNNHSRIPNADEVENFPPEGRPVPTNQFKVNW